VDTANGNVDPRVSESVGKLIALAGVAGQEGDAYNIDRRIEINVLDVFIDDADIKSRRC
jgi:hypothetical protein